LFKQLEKIPALIKETGKEFAAHQPLLIGAAISFYVILSLGPILVITIFVIGSIFGEKAVEGKIVEQINLVVGEKPAQIIQMLIERAYKFPSKTTTIISSIPLLFFGGTMIFYQIRNAINLIWETNSTEDGFTEKAKAYSFSFVMLFVLGSLILLLTIKSPLLLFLRKYFLTILPFPVVLLEIMDLLFNFIAFTFLFGMIYRILPSINIKWSDVLIGAAFTSFFFLLVQFLIGINFDNINLEHASGAIGSITILIIWIFYSSLIFLFGANFTKAYAKKYGSFIERQQSA
jgi:membrane protein